MQTPAISLTSADLKAAIIPHPLVVAPEQPLSAVIIQMAEGSASENCAATTSEPGTGGQSGYHCALVVQGGRLLGLITEQRIVQLIAQGESLQRPVRDCMPELSAPLRITASTSFEAVEQRLTRHRYLPVVDEQDRILGVMTWESLYRYRRCVAPAHLQELKLQRDFNQLIAEITSRFVDVSLGELDTEINRTLRLLGEATQVDTSYVFQLAQPVELQDQPLDSCDRWQSHGTMTMTHEWCQQDAQRQMAQTQAVPLAAFPWSMERLCQRQVLYVANVDSLPPAAAVDQASWRQFNLVSVLAIPLIRQSRLVGVMGFASFTRSLMNDSQVIRLLQVMGQTITSTQSRLQAEAALYASEQRFRRAVLDAPYPIILHAEDGEVLHINQTWIDISGYTPSDIPTITDWTEKAYGGKQAAVRAEIESLYSRSSRVNEGEFTIHTKAGAQRIWEFSSAPMGALPDGRRYVLSMAVDVTDRRQAEAERQAAQQMRLELKLLETILDVALAGYWDWDIPHHKNYMSPGLKRIFGYTDGELANVPDTWQALMFPDDLPGVMACFERHVHSRGQIPFYNEVRYRHKNGSTVWVICSGQVIEWDADGNPLRMVGCHVDITARKRAEEQLQKNDRHLTTAQRIGKLGSWEFDVETQQITWSDEVFRIFRRDPAAGPPTYQELLQFFVLEDRAYHDQMVRAAIQHAQPYELESCGRHADGTLFYIQARGEPIFDATGQLKQLIGTVLDITDRKRTENQLQNLSDRLSLALDAGAIGTWNWNLVDVADWDDRMYEIYGLQPLGRPMTYEDWINLVHPEDRESLQSSLQQAIQGKQDFQAEFRILHGDGAIRWIRSAALVQLDTLGQPLRMIGINVDVTASKLAEARLLRTKAQLEASNRELEAFAYSVSHDLRAPLRAIDGFSQALLEDYGHQVDADGQDYFDRIRRNVERMGRLIDDLLRLSRVSRSEMQYGWVNLSALVRDHLEEQQVADPSRQVEVVIAPNVTVWADATLMQVVIHNLLQNAWKFTSHHAQARIEFGVMAQANQPVYFVKDDGAGFDMAYSNMLFGVFQRLHNTQEFPGTGIGLATVQRVIHRHGGKLWAEGALEQGATIYFTVPDAEEP